MPLVFFIRIALDFRSLRVPEIFHQYQLFSFISMRYFFCLVFPSMTFIDILQSSVYNSFTCLVKFMPKYFILCIAILNLIYFIFYLVFSFLLEYRNIINFYMKIIYNETICMLFLNFILLDCSQLKMLYQFQLQSKITQPQI